ncbi:hypothetical protein BJY04DRAFT_223764 [Aspergillus karnatakaensis]|uniref:uncharacterized protein n=1 Tax=Aspergillus karnatakaensis TaxID=1810916 RepID=UPI003CCE476E
MSVSVSFGSGGTVSHFGNPGLVATDSSESTISQTFVLGIFLAIFAAQMAVNVVHALRTRQQQARVAGTQAAQGRPGRPGLRQPVVPPPPEVATQVAAEVQDEVEGRDSRSSQEESPNMTDADTNTHTNTPSVNTG